MAGKRRADGPASKRPPTRKPAGKSPGKSASAQAEGAAWRRWLARTLKWGTAVGLVFALIGVAAAVVVYRAIDIPNPNKAFQTETTYVYYADGKSRIGKFASDQERESIDYGEMPDHVKNAVVAAEDRSFWTNPGIDVKGILRAAFSNARGNDRQGASTITQQYVKILYLTSEQSYKRKIKEAVVARKLSKELSKEAVLAGYLNTIYFGRGAYGIDAAARAYFQVPATELNLRQAAALAAVINNPTLFNPDAGEGVNQYLLERYHYVLNGMATMSQDPTYVGEPVDEATIEKAKKRLPKFSKPRADSAYGGQRGHVMELVKKELLRTGQFTEEQINGGGLRIYTTLTKRAMTAAEQGVKEVQPQGLKGLHTAVASVEPGTGALRGFYAGQDYLQSQINWAVSGGQPGSTFKAFALAAGISSGYALKDTFEGNSPLELPDGIEVNNLGEDGGNDYGAKINLITATEKSVNTAFVDLTMGLPNGPSDVVKMARRLGIPANKGGNTMDRLHSTPGLEANATVALGSASVSPINMANAYATIANGGERAEAYVIEKVTDRNGEELYRHTVKTKQALEEDVASDVSYALQKVVETPGASGTRAQALGRPAAGKTGTATNQDDEVSSSWFVGYTPQMATAVMYVRGRGNESLENFLVPHYGGTYPTQTWVAVMQRILEGEPVEDFPPPALLDGEAPEDGHAPVTPKPKPTKTATPTPTTELPTELPTTEPPSENPGPDCSIKPDNPNCPTEEPTPTPVDCVIFPNDPACLPTEEPGSDPGKPGHPRSAAREEELTRS